MLLNPDKTIAKPETVNLLASAYANTALRLQGVYHGTGKWRLQVRGIPMKADEANNDARFSTYDAPSIKLATWEIAPYGDIRDRMPCLPIFFTQTPLADDVSKSKTNH